MEEIPWEWVEGDPVRTGQYGFVIGIFTGVALSLAVVLALDLLSWVGHLLSPPPVPTWPLILVTQAILWPEVFFLFYFPRHFPIIGRLGISPAGLRLILPRRQVNVPWDSVQGFGPDWVAVHTGTFNTERYRLTPHQAERLKLFARPH
jgi:hypothetical protein